MSITLFGTGIHQESNVELHGGKGAGLIDMCNMDLQVPEGFILDTNYCNLYNGGAINDTKMDYILEDVRDNIITLMDYNAKPLLLSIRSGARVSMPGMMDTILNVGITEQTLNKWIKVLGKKPALDSYCRLLYMMGETAYGIDKEYMSNRYNELKGNVRYENIIDLLTQNLIIADVPHFWKDVNIQYRDAIKAVWNSWNSDRAITYRELHGYSHDWGTAVTIQRMVFGNLNDNSCSGVVFTRNPDTGENKLYGEFLLNAQGEDVVAGTVTPEDITELQDAIPQAYEQLCLLADVLEKEKKDIQDIEFTVEDGYLYLLQTRDAKRSSTAVFNAAYDFYIEGVVTLEQAVARCKYSDYLNVSKVTVDYAKAKPAQLLGIAASSGVVSAKTTTDIDMVIKHPNQYILIRKETTPDDLAGMIASKGIITQTGGATSHAAVVARGLGIPCIVGCTDIKLDGTMAFIPEGILNNNHTTITMDGSSGCIWVNTEVPLTDGNNVSAEKLVKLALVDHEQQLSEYSINIKKVTKKEYHNTYISVLGDFLEVGRVLSTLPSTIHVTICLDAFSVGNKVQNDDLLEIMDLGVDTETLKSVLLINDDKKDNVTFITVNNDLKNVITECNFKLQASTDYIGGILNAKADNVFVDIDFLSNEDELDVIELAKLAGVNAFRLCDITSKGTAIKEWVFKA